MSKFSVRKPLTIFVAVLAVIILGVVAFTRMTPDLLPNMDFPYVIIMTTYPGQSPEVVEQEITRPLEQSMATLDHIKEVSSTSQENYSLVVLEFEDSVNMDTVGVDIQQSISALQGSWDDTVGSPYVLKINPSVLPIGIAAVSKSDMDITELSDFLDETIVPKLEGVAGVARVSTSGSIYRQVNVVISQKKIDAVNKRMADKVNGRLDDAQAELDDAKAELDSAKEELENAKAELDSGKDTLVEQSATAQATLSEKQMELLNGKLEIQNGIAQMQSAQSQIATALQMLQPIEDGYVQARASRDEAAGQLALLDVLEAAQSALDTLVQEQTDRTLDNASLALDIPAKEAEIAALLAQQAAEGLTPEQEQQLAQAQTDLADMQARQAANDARLAALNDTEIPAAQAAVDAARAPFGEGELPVRQALEAQQTAAQAVIDGLDQLLASGSIEGVANEEELLAQIATLTATQTELDSQIAQLQSTLSQLDSGAVQLSQAMGVLSQSQSAGLLQLADAATQLTVNAATVDSALAEVESGMEQLADSRADALAQADISGTITLEMVAQILGAQNFSMPAGYIQEDGVSYMVSVGDEITRERDLELLLLFDTGEDGIGPIYLEDVADVFITDNSDQVYAKLNGADSVMLTFEKQSNAATAEVSDALRARFDELEEQYPGLEFALLMDQGDYIYLIINSILSSLASGAIFSIIILFLFLRDLRPTAITLVSIPVSVIFAFVLMYFSGVTLNMISLSGLAVAVGMLVDNSIVVIENIYRLRSKGATAVQAAVVGAKQVAGAITASTLTTVCVFAPIVFVEGITKKLFTDLALTMTYSLMASLLIALTLVPAMAKGMLKDRKRGRHSRRDGTERRESVFYRVYRVLAGWNLRHKWFILTVSLALLCLTAWGALGKGFSFMPEIDMNTVSVTITMPEDADRDEAVDLADQALERIAQTPGAQYVGAMMSSGSGAALGGGMGMGMGGAAGGGQYDVTVYVGLPEGASGAEAGAWIADRCADLACEVSYDSAMMDMSMLTGSGITVNLFGEDMQDLQQAAGNMAGALRRVEGVAEVDDGLEDAQTAYHVSVDRNAAMQKGYTVAQIYMDIATALTSSATAMDMDMDSVTADVVVQNEDGMSLADLKAYTFESTNQMTGETTSFRLDEVATVEPTVSMSSISRIDQRRYMSVTALLEPGYNVTLVTADAQRAVEDLLLPEGVSYEFAGENETIMDAVEDLMLMLLIGVILVYFIMVAQFQSLKSPFIVMFTIPLAFTGGFAALLVCHMDVSIVSIIGFVMLVGIIVNNGIVLVDYVNQLRAAGMERREALVEAGVTRMRPIFMTSLTTILGLIVMAMGQNVGTSLMQPVAVVCIGGLLYATIMTLFVVPCIYDILNRRELKVITDEDMQFEDHDIV